MTVAVRHSTARQPAHPCWFEFVYTCCDIFVLFMLDMTLLVHVSRSFSGAITETDMLQIHDNQMPGFLCALNHTACTNE